MMNLIRLLVMPLVAVANGDGDAAVTAKSLISFHIHTSTTNVMPVDRRTLINNKSSQQKRGPS